MIEGKAVELAEMLACRERRAEAQRRLLALYRQPLISYCMNIPGTIKTNDSIRAAFASGRTLLIEQLQENRIAVLHQEEQHEITGDELLLVLNAPASQLKELTLRIEETHPLGRLFDMDVIDTDGQKLSRKIYRKCLVCGRQAQDCARSRRHSATTLQAAVERLLKEVSA